MAIYATREGHRRNFRTNFALDSLQLTGVGIIPSRFPINLWVNWVKRALQRSRYLVHEQNAQDRATQRAQHVLADNDITGDGQEERNAQICNGVDCTANDCVAQRLRDIGVLLRTRRSFVEPMVERRDTLTATGYAVIDVQPSDIPRAATPSGDSRRQA